MNQWYEREITRLKKEHEALRQAAWQCRIALEPYDDVKPRDWKTDREKLAAAYKAICAELNKEQS